MPNIEHQTLFAVSVHKFDELDSVNLAKKIVEENRIIINGNDSIRAVATNFVQQNTTRHLVNEDYVNLEDVSKLKKIILNNSINVLLFYDYYDPSLEYEVTNMWFNIIRTNGDAVKHHHSGFLLSGTFYVNVPDCAGPIKFFNPISNYFYPTMEIKDRDKNYNSFNSHGFTIHPKTGEMYFWLSNLEHSVLCSEFEGERITCSYDIAVKDRHGT
jgi:uncharacterized protein (TIGR02466 family)